MPNEVRIKVIVDDDSGPGIAKSIAEQKALQRESKTSSDSIRSAFMDTKQSMLGAALALSPAILPMAAGVAAGVGTIGAAFGAAGIGAIGFGVTAKSVLSSASGDASKYSTLMTQLANDTTSKQRAATNQQMAILQQGWSNTYKTVVLDIVGIESKWRNTSRDIASPVLVPWLSAVNKGISFLKPLIGPVADDFKSWGQSVNQYLGSDKGSKEVGALATAFGKFSATQLKDIGLAAVDVGKGIFHLGQDASGAVPFIDKVGPKLDSWGASFKKWSESKGARDDVHSFLKYLHDNGSQLMSFVGQLGKLMPSIFQGASAIGTAELQAMTAFLTFVNKLPKAWQKPIVELAGAMLILKKTGVITVGVKLVQLGMKAGAAAGASAAGSAAGNAAAGNEAKSGFSGAIGGALSAAILPAGLVAGGVLAGAVVRGYADKMSPSGTEAGKINKATQSVFSGIPGFNIFAGFMAKSDVPLGNWLTRMQHEVSNSFDGARHEASHIWDTMWDNTLGRLQRGVADDGKVMDGFRHGVANHFDGARHDMASAWDTAWNNTVGRTRNGVGDVVNWVNNLPGDITHIFKGTGSLLLNSGKNIVTGLGSGAKSAWNAVASFFKGIPGDILHFLGIHSPPQWAIDAGKHIVNGLHVGMKAGGGTLGAFKGANVLGQLQGGIMGGVGGGVNRWSGLVLQALKMLHLPSAYLHDVLVQMQSESGGNPNAINLTDSNALAGHPSKGLMQVILGTFNEWAGPFRSLGQFNPFANIYAALNYAKHGAGFGTGPFQIGSGHGYAAGGPAQGWIMAGEHGRELIRVPPSSHVFPHGQTEGMMTHGGSGGHMTIGLAPGTSDSKLMKEIIKQLRVVVFDAGGNVQDVLGWKS